MKILLISNMFPPFIMGGAEMAAHSLALWLARNGHQVHVLTSAHQSKVEGIEEMEPGLIVERRFFPSVYQIYKANASNPLIKYVWHAHDHFHLHAEAIVAGVIAQVQPVLINVHNLQGIGYNILRMIGRSRIPCVQVLHDFGLICVNQNRFKNGRECERHHLPCQLSTMVKRSYFHTIQQLSYWSPSVALLDSYRPFLAPHIRAEAIPLPLYFSQSKTVKMASDVPRLLYVGQVVPWKGVGFIIETLRKLPLEIRFQLDVIGGGRELVELQTRHAGNAQIRFHGKQPPEKVGDFMTQADLLLVPSLWFENAPLVISQAIQSGLPVFASDIGGLREMVADDLSGRLLPAGDESAWAAALRLALTDPQHLKRWKTGAGQRKNIFATETLGERVVDLFSQTMADQTQQKSLKEAFIHEPS